MMAESWQFNKSFKENCLKPR